MAEYKYEGVDRAGKRQSGQLNASSEGDLRVLLRAKGIRPVKIATVGMAQRDLFSIFKGGQAVAKPEDILVFTRQLQVLIGSGVPLVQSLDILADQSASGAVRTICLAIKTKVSEGAYLWESLAVFNKTFPKLFVALVRAGESSGALDGMLKRLTSYLEDSDRLKRMLKSAMMYPIIVTCIGIGVVFAMLTFVIPKFEDMLKGSGTELPGPTQFVINLSHFLVNNLHWIVIGVGLLGYFGKKYFTSPEGAIVLDRTFFYAPIFGNIMQKGGTARFARTMGTLLSSGVNLLDAIDICQATIDNAVLEQAVAKIRPEVEQGKSLSSVFGKLDVFPKMAIQMINVGENTGQLDKMLEKVADFYEAEVEILVGGLTKLIEPLILVFLGGAVGGLLIAMYLPIFKMASGV